MKEKNGKKITYRYDILEGLDQASVDRYLVSMFNLSDLSKLILVNSVLAKNLHYNRIQLLNETIPYDQLVDDISGQIQNSYPVFNNLMSKIFPGIQRLEDQLKKELGYKLANKNEQLEYLYSQMNIALSGDPLKKNKLVCWLRNKPDLHSKLVELVNDNVIFEEEESMPITEKELPEATFGQQIGIIKNLIIKMEEQAKEIDEGSKKSLKAEMDELHKELEESKKELRGKEKELKNKEKEIRKVQKKYDDELNKREKDQKAIEKYQKENGELGKKLGEIRKEVDGLKAANLVLEKDVQRLEKVKKQMINSMESDFDKKLKDKVTLLKSDYEDQILKLEDTIEKTQKMNEKLYEGITAQNSELLDENEKLKAQLEELKEELKQKEITANNNEETKPEKEKEEETEALLDLFDGTIFEPEFS